MTTTKHKEIVLETIDQLRKRKARPDFERICHMLYRRHGLTKAEVQSELDLLVDAEVVIKVDYKGNTSYRNAAKWVRFNKSLLSNPAAAASAAGSNGPHATTLKVSRMIGDAVKDLWTAGHRDTTGITPAQVENYLATREGGFKLTKGALELAFEKEVTAGRLVRLSGGNYSLSETEKQRLEKLSVQSKPKPPTQQPQLPPQQQPQTQATAVQTIASAPAPVQPSAPSTPPQEARARTPPSSCRPLQTPNAKRARPLSKRKVRYSVSFDFLFFFRLIGIVWDLRQRIGPQSRGWSVMNCAVGISCARRLRFRR